MLAHPVPLDASPHRLTLLSLDKCAQTIEVAERQNNWRISRFPPDPTSTRLVTDLSPRYLFAEGNLEIGGLHLRAATALCAKYGPGEGFGVHADAPHVDYAGQLSTHTLLIYLNDVLAGGATYFPDHGLSFSPCAGDAIFFRHEVRHGARAISAGAKYVLYCQLMKDASLGMLT
jgi:hypothetical protein